MCVGSPKGRWWKPKMKKKNGQLLCDPENIPVRGESGSVATRVSGMSQVTLTAEPILAYPNLS